MKKAIILIVIVVLFSITSVTIAYSQEDVDLLLEKGLESYRNGTYYEAISYFEKVLEVEPDNLRALNYKGGSLVPLGKHDEAISYFDRVLEIEPNYVSSLVNKGSVLASLGDFDDAIFYLDKALDIEPNNIDALSNKAAVLVEQGKHDEAINLLDKALEIEPNNIDVLSNRATISLITGNAVDVITFYHKILEIDPNHELAKEFIPIARQSVGYLTGKGFTEFTIRDAQGVLITHFKKPYIAVLNHQIGIDFVNSWDVTQEISLDDAKYQVLQRAYTYEYQQETVFAGNLIYYDVDPSLRLIYSPNWGFPVLNGDIMTVVYTLYKPIE